MEYGGWAGANSRLLFVKYFFWNVNDFKVVYKTIDNINN